MKHLNNHVLCAISIRATGKTPGYHDALRIYVASLTTQLQICQEYPIFSAVLKPTRYKNYVDNPRTRTYLGRPLVEYINNGVDKDTATMLFRRWYDGLLLRFNKRIIPLVYDWADKREWLLDIMGVDFHDFFDKENRDILTISRFVNDRFWYFGERMPFAKYELASIAEYCNVDNPKSATGSGDIHCLVNSYRAILGMRMP